MFKLSNLIFLDEGLLKIPPKLSEAVKKEAYSVFAAKYSILLEDKINKIKNQLIQTQKDFDTINSISDNVLQTVHKLAKNVSVTGNPETYEIPFKFSDFEETNDGTKVAFEIVLTNYNSKYAIKVNQIDRKPGAAEDKFVIEYFSNQNNNFSESLEEFDGWLNDLPRKLFGIYIDEFKDVISDKISSLQTLKQNAKPIYDMKTPEDAKTHWGFNSVITLTPEMFEGWQPGNKNIDITKLLYLKFKQQKSPQLYLRHEYKRSPTQIFKTPGGGESYLGYYSSMKKYGGTDNVYEIVIVIPYIDIDTGNFDYQTEAPLEELNTTIDHELGHLVQELIQQIATGKSQREFSGAGYKFGVNSKKISNKIEREQYPKHELRDVEFYTRLGDVKTQIEKNLIYSSPKSKLIYFKNFIGYPKETTTTIRWLSVLKKENPRKYFKAVKELYKIFFPENIQTNKLGKTI